MGASHGTLATAADEEEQGNGMPDYAVEQRLYPGSGRMMQTFRLKSVKTDAVVVCKTMTISKQDSTEKQEKELQRIKDALKGHNHVAPYQVWYKSEYKLDRCSVYMLRQHVYTTLSDRLASRPFLTQVEKCWIVYQLLNALEKMHQAGVVHGFLTTENVGLTSWNHVVLLDISSYKARTALVDDDPFEYLHYFEQVGKGASTDSTRREKACYLAPERFYTPSLGETPKQTPLTPAMDIFSAGCVLLETFLNGQRAMDLGDLMEYRKEQEITGSLQQRLGKIESSALRAACRHMLSLNPSQRLSAKEYCDRLAEIMPSTFESTLTPLMETITQEITPDARMSVAALQYDEILRATVGVSDEQGQQYLQRILGQTVVQLQHGDKGDDDKANQENIPGNMSAEDRLMAETEALLKKLDAADFYDDDDDPVALSQHDSPSNQDATTPNTPTCPKDASSLLIYIQLVLSTVRTVQRPYSKLVGLHLLKRLGKYTSADVKLQRIVPTTISLLHDQDSLVRALAIHVMTFTLSSIKKFAPSDSKIFPQYIFKRVAHLISDVSLVVRVAFSRCIAPLCETAHLFLDISHAVRLYEAVGASDTSSSKTELAAAPTTGVFSDDVAKLLDDGTAKAVTDKNHPRRSTVSVGGGGGQTLISSTYATELAALQEVVSRWVVHITTDQSDQSSPPKQALLGDLARLCNFFGRNGVLSFMLPQILAFLNDRRDWQLRAALFENLASVCSIIGRAATEHFVLPCLETALVDVEDQVMSRALLCLASLVEMGLLSRSVLVNPQAVLPSTGLVGKPVRGLFGKYVPLLLYPSSDVRRSAVTLVNVSFRALDFPDGAVFLLPLLRPFLRFDPCAKHLTTPEGLERCLVAPWTRARLNNELKRLSPQSNRDTQLASTQWMTIDEEPADASKMDASASQLSQAGDTRSSLLDPKSDIVDENDFNECIVDYLTMLSRSRGAALFHANAPDNSEELSTAIEGSLKLAQHVKFPNQQVAGTAKVSIPSWYSSLRDASENDRLPSELRAIQSLSSLRQVYGLSVIQDPLLVDSGEASDTVIVGQKADASPKEETKEPDAAAVLETPEARLLEGAIAGEWGSDTLVDPTVADTALLVTKLNGLNVPPLPPNLGVLYPRSDMSLSDSANDSNVASEWKPKIDMLVASSNLVSGHSGPVSRLSVAPDERYFVSGSHDGTVRVWETRQVESSDGVLTSSVTYTGHSDGCEQQRCPRINDVANLENTHSVVSGASDGSVHVWRVDLTSPQNESRDVHSGISESSSHDRSRVSGSSTIRTVDAKEGEVLAVSHFNSPSASIIAFATQGYVHSLDLRCPREPFKLKHQPDTGYLTSMALGSDRHWLITGTSRGFVALWDIRFQQTVKLWQHSSGCPVSRLATTYTALPKKFGGRSSTDTEKRPFMFVACGRNECGMFDAVTGSCRQSFRVVGHTDADISAMPVLRDMDVGSRKLLKTHDFSEKVERNALGCSINALVGSVGGFEHNYLITGGDDGYIRNWDFSNPGKCYTVSGHPAVHHRPSYERVDAQGQQRLMLCRQAPEPRYKDVESSRLARMLERGVVRTENRHHDSVQDVKLINFPFKSLLSCSRDGTVKLWR